MYENKCITLKFIRSTNCPWVYPSMRWTDENNIVICYGSKNSSKLEFSRLQLIDSCHGDSSVKGRNLLRSLICKGRTIRKVMGRVGNF